MSIDDRASAAPDVGGDQQQLIHPGWIVAAFFAVYVVVALAAQAVSAIPASEEGSAIEAFTSGLLWMLALFGLLAASTSTDRLGRLGFWVAFTAALGALAVDEIVGVHERTEPNLNDDWVKIVLWIGTPFVLVAISRMLDADRPTNLAWIAGYVFHTAYLLVELGDGEFFDLPFAESTLKGAEEVFELFFLAAYAFGFWLVAIRDHRRSMHAAA